MNPAPRPSQHPTDAQLARMRQAGRVTAAEAAALKEADDDRARHSVLGGIRARHITARLTPAVADGRMTADQAESLAARARAGEHGRELRLAVNNAVKATPRPDPETNS